MMTPRAFTIIGAAIMSVQLALVSETLAGDPAIKQTASALPASVAAAVQFSADTVTPDTDRREPRASRPESDKKNKVKLLIIFLRLFDGHRGAIP